MIRRADQGLAARLQTVSASLTPGQRRIAEILMANQHEAAFIGIEELAQRASSSVATVVRFAKTLGYAGFLEMRKSFVHTAKKQVRRGDQLLQAPDEASATLVEVARRDIRNIERVVQEVDDKRLLGIVKHLKEGRTRLIIGDGVSALMARHLAYLLINAGLPVMEGNPADFATQVGNLGTRDLLIAFSIAPYSRETLDAAAYAKKRGIKVLAFTDDLQSPLGKVATLAVPLPGENLFYSHSLAAFGVLAHAIATTLARQDPKGALKKMREVERIAGPKFASEAED
jgi:DNA-binding MurR/RpiR family transcriptional regulator